MFVRNLQGDVLSLINAANGEVLIEYSYDAWGNMEYTVVGEGLQDNAETAMLLTALCPLTYRGYNYDFTTGLYYLQSRYYNPEWGRFLNMDDLSILLATTDEVLGSNLYAYCCNNPVNKADYSGQWYDDVHSGAFSKDITGRHGYYQTAYLYNYYIPYKPYKRSGKLYYGTFYWAIQCGFSIEQAEKIGYYCNRVDLIYSPAIKSKQCWHFNTFANTSVGLDSRTLLGIIKLIEAYHYFQRATNAKILDCQIYHDYMELGMEALGTALHPLQDYYAHTADRVKLLPGGLIWSHLHRPDTDNVIVRWNQLLATQNVTMEILSAFYREFKWLFKSEANR